MGCTLMYSGGLVRLLRTTFVSPRIAGLLDSGGLVERASCNQSSWMVWPGLQSICCWYWNAHGIDQGKDACQ